MEIDVNGELGEITNTEKESILNNIGTLAETPYGTIPLLRDAGVHMPQNASAAEMNKYTTEVMEQADTYEDRAEVVQVSAEDQETVKVVVKYGIE